MLEVVAENNRMILPSAVPINDLRFDPGTYRESGPQPFDGETTLFAFTPDVSGIRRLRTSRHGLIPDEGSVLA